VTLDALATEAVPSRGDGNHAYTPSTQIAALGLAASRWVLSGKGFRPMEFDERRRVSKRTFASTPFRVYCVFLVIVALSGGSSKIDAGGQMLVRIASIAVIAFVCFASAPISFRVYRPLFLLLTGATLLVLIQLVPLPPAAWLDLPGRQMYAEAVDAAGFSQPWRPLNLVPERGWNALYSLLPPAAALILISTLDRESIRNTIHVWALVALASAIAGLIQIVAGPQNNFHLYSGPDEQSAVGLFANRNHQALLLCCGITMLSAWPSVGKDAYSQRLTLVLATLGIVFMILMVSATGSRAGLIIEAFALVTGALLAAPAVLSFLNVLNSWKKGIVAGVATAKLATRNERIQRGSNTWPSANDHHQACMCGCRWEEDVRIGARTAI